MSKPDWEAIETAYRPGSLSVRAFGEKQGVKYVILLKRENKEGLQRDHHGAHYQMRPRSSID
ncbi:hypothetical protein FFW75_20880 [Escherichia coli]|nr:hypothetical protein [Escherichia coli]